MAESIFTSTNTAITGNSYTDENLKNLQDRVDKANEALKNYNTTAATDEELRKRAENEYNPIYNAQVAEQEALKQSAGTTLENQLSALQRQYARNQETTNKNYDAQRVTANNTMLARGLNNSSLALAMLNRVEDQRNRALLNLTEEHTASENAARGAYNDTVTAADKAMARLKSDLATNIDARISALRDAEQNRVMTATQAQNQLTQYMTSLMLEIEQLRQNAYNQYMNQVQLEKEYGSSGSGGSSGGGSSSGSSAGSAGSASGSGSSLADKYNSSGSGISDILKKAQQVSSAASGGAANALKLGGTVGGSAGKVLPSAKKTTTKKTTNAYQQTGSTTSPLSALFKK